MTDQHNGVLDPDQEVKEKRRSERPKLYKCVVVNDDYTPMEFVVALLVKVFKHDTMSATRVMLETHRKGRGVAGVYTKDIAETRAVTAMDLARQYEHPLLVDVEPEDGDGE